MFEIGLSIAVWIWGLTALALLAWVTYVVWQDTPAWYHRLDRWLSGRKPWEGGIGDPIVAGFHLAGVVVFSTLFAVIIVGSIAELASQ